MPKKSITNDQEMIQSAFHMSSTYMSGIFKNNFMDNYKYEDRKVKEYNNLTQAFRDMHSNQKVNITKELLENIKKVRGYVSDVKDAIPNDKNFILDTLDGMADYAEKVLNKVEKPAEEPQDNQNDNQIKNDEPKTYDFYSAFGYHLEVRDINYIIDRQEFDLKSVGCRDKDEIPTKKYEALLTELEHKTTITLEVVGLYKKYVQEIANFYDKNENYLRKIENSYSGKTTVCNLFKQANNNLLKKIDAILEKDGYLLQNKKMDELEDELEKKIADDREKEREEEVKQQVEDAYAADASNNLKVEADLQEQLATEYKIKIVPLNKQEQEEIRSSDIEAYDAKKAREADNIKKMADNIKGFYKWKDADDKKHKNDVLNRLVKFSKKSKENYNNEDEKTIRTAMTGEYKDELCMRGKNAANGVAYTKFFLKMLRSEWYNSSQYDKIISCLDKVEKCAGEKKFDEKHFVKLLDDTTNAAQGYLDYADKNPSDKFRRVKKSVAATIVKDMVKGLYNEMGLDAEKVREYVQSDVEAMEKAKQPKVKAKSEVKLEEKNDGGMVIG